MAKKQPEESAKKGRGRPMGPSKKGRLEERYVVRCTPAYRAWMAELAEHVGAPESEVFREAMRRYAAGLGYVPPPIR